MDEIDGMAEKEVHFEIINIINPKKSVNEKPQFAYQTVFDNKCKKLCQHF